MIRMKRTTNYIDSSVQGALLRRIFCHWLFFFFVTGVSVVTLQTLLGDPGVSIVDRFRAEMSDFFLIGVIMLALLPAFMLDTVRFSNRFVGPIVRLRRHIRELGADGNTDKCTFRSDDFWNGMASEFNSVTNLIEHQKAEIESLKAQLAAKETADV